MVTYKFSLHPNKFQQEDSLEQEKQIRIINNKKLIQDYRDQAIRERSSQWNFNCAFSSECKADYLEQLTDEQLSGYIDFHDIFHVL